MNTKKILGVVAVLALVAVAMVGAGAATSIYVDENSSSATTDGSYDNPYKSFAAAYTAASNGDVIYLKADTTITDGTTNNVFEIVKNITINADPVKYPTPATTKPVLTTSSGVYVSIGNYTASTSTAPYVVIKNVILRNGSDNANLIQITAKNSNLTLENVTADMPINGLVVINHAYNGRDGGNGSTVTIDNCKVDQGCTSIIDSESGIITLWETGTVTVTNSNITTGLVPFVKACVGTTGAHTLCGRNCSVSADSTNQITTSLDKYVFSVVDSSGEADSNTVVIAGEQSKGTTVKLNITAQYTFSVPSEIILKGNTTEGSNYNIGVIGLKSSAATSGKKLSVSLLSVGTGEQASTDTFKVLNGSNYAQYKLKDSTGATTYAINGEVASLALSDPTSLSNETNLRFVTTDLTNATAAGDYSGSMTFKMEVTNATLSMTLDNGGGTITWTPSTTPVTIAYNSEVTAITDSDGAGYPATITIGGVVYSATKEGSYLGGFKYGGSELSVGETITTSDTLSVGTLE